MKINSDTIPGIVILGIGLWLFIRAIRNLPQSKHSFTDYLRSFGLPIIIVVTGLILIFTN